MDTTKLLTGTLAGTVTSFIVGFLTFGLLLKDYAAANHMDGFTKDPPDYLWLVIGHVVFAFLVTYIFLKWAGISTAVSGAKAAFIIGILFSLGINCFLHGESNIFNGLEGVFVHAIVGSVIWAAGGAGVGWALGRGN
jgi:hypothetical protein